MKRVVFGYEGGFPLEQETLMQIQAAYEEDMLEALFALWGLDVTKRYLIKKPLDANDEGWIISPQTILARGEGETTAVSETRLQIMRLNYFAGGNRVVIEDRRLADGNLPYSEGSENKVYEEFVAKLVNSPLKDSIDLKSFIPLKSILEIASNVISNSNEINAIKEDYLPRDGSKPMTGNLNLGVDKSKLTPGEEGTRLYFKGTGSNTDSIYMSKHTPSVDVTELRVNVGDNAQTSSKDAFVVGGTISGQSGWHEKFRVQTDGKVGIGVNNPSKNLDVDAGNNSLKFQNLAEVSSQTPLVIDSQGNVGKNSNGITSANFIPGMIMMWSGNVNNVPTGWILCDGNGGTQINGLTIPDLRGRFVVGFSASSSTTPTINSNKNTENYGRIHNKGGQRNVALSSSEIPAHRHKMQLTSGAFFPTQTRNPGGSGEGHRRTMDEALDNNAFTDNNTGGGQSHENRPPYYVLAFIMYVGDFNLNPISRIRFSDGTIAQKTQIVPLGETFTISLDGRTSSDPDGDTIVNYHWRKCFQNEDWVNIGTTTNGLKDFVVPAGRYGLHYFGLRVEDSAGNFSEWTSFAAAIRYSIIRPIIITPTAISLSTNRVIFEGYELAGVQTIQITGNPGWRIRSKDSFIEVTPSSSSTNTATTVNLFIRPNPSTRNTGTIVFETTDGADTATLNWSALIPIDDNPIDIGIGGGGGSCFDLESDILMASGQSKKLKNIVIGDELRTLKLPNAISSTTGETRLLTDLMKGGTKEIGKVVDFGIQTVEEYRKITLVNGEVLNVTASHPILGSKDNAEVAWLLPDDLRGGYHVVDKNGKLVEIESKRTVKASLEIGVLQLDNGDNYFVNDVMVHNANIIRTIARTANSIQAEILDQSDVIQK